MPSPTSVIAAGSTVEGNLSADETLVIYGQLRGAIVSSTDVVVEDGAVLEADVHAARVQVRGIIVGDIAASELLVVGETGRILGDIRATKLRLVAGGRVSGQVDSGSSVSPPRLSRSRAHASRRDRRMSSASASTRRTVGQAPDEPVNRRVDADPKPAPKPQPEPRPQPKVEPKANSKAETKASQRADQGEVVETAEQAAPEPVGVD